jgi:hypothetical protein
MRTLPDNIKEIRFSDGAGMIYSALIVKSAQDNFMVVMWLNYSILMVIFGRWYGTHTQAIISF